MDSAHIEIIEASIDQVSVLRNLLQLYVYDFSEIEGFELNDHGLFRYRYLDHYWTDEDRHPFLIYIDGTLGGFALVNTVTFAEESDFNIAEFFILRKYRRKGIGTRVAHHLFDMFPGWWEVRQTTLNVAAQDFWRNVIAAYGSDEFNDYPNGTGASMNRPLQTVLSRTVAD